LVEPRLLLASFTVNSADDDPSGPTPGMVTLRDAINDVNNDTTDVAGNPDVIKFAISGTPTISLAADLPPITVPVFIDGTSQPGYSGSPLIQIDGTSAGLNANGLTISGGNSTVQGLDIEQFGGNGIDLNSNGGDVIGGTTPGAGNIISGNVGDGVRIINGSNYNLVQGNSIGTDASGTQLFSNGANGVEISGSDHNTIGGTTPGAGNVISGNFGDGVRIFNSNDNLVQGNSIGTDASGTEPLGNVGNGVEISLFSLQNTIGGTTPGAGNVISDNVGDGVRIFNSNDNLVQGNSIGTDASGTEVLANSGDGVEINFFSQQNTIGGTTPGAGNVILNNSGDGVRIINDSNDNLVQGNSIGTNGGTQPVGNLGNGVEINFFSQQNTIGGTTPAAGNVISGNFGDGVRIILNSNDNLVQGNSIGTNADGTQPHGNLGNGVEINFFSQQNTIGGTTPGAGNVISDNGGDGVLITKVSSGNLVQGNSIGTNGGTNAGTQPLGNVGDGVEIYASEQNTIGGATPGARNLISGNFGDGVLITKVSSGNLVQGNYIGTNASGTEALGNIQGGVSIGNAATQNLIGGTTPGAGNVISGNFDDGVSIIGTASIDTTGNLVEGNYIGTDVAGERPLGNRGNGVSITAAPGNSIGGFTALARNVISGNGQNGIAISSVQPPSGGGPFLGSLVVGNFIGTDVFGSLPLGNGGDGILLDTAASNTIGGTTPAASNILSGNSVAGVEIRGGGSSLNLVEGNYIGTDKTGTKEMGNGVGVMIEAGARNNTLGGTVRGAPNVITHNHNDGVDVLGTDTSANQVLGTDTSANQILGNIISGNFVNGVHLSGAGATDNTIADNTIGLDASGNLAGNGVDGILADKGATGNTIGGSTETDYNIIAGNPGAGVHITDPDTKMNRVQGNFIGTDSSGKKSIGNGTGVLINDSTDNTIGGTINGSTNPANVIGGNGVGIEISGFNSSLIGPNNFNFIEGNCIGVTEAENGSPIGNVYGIWINDVPNNMVGGPAQDERNTISDNEWAGVYISGPDATGNLVEGNSILGRNNKGTKTSPTNPLPIGVFIQNSSKNKIGDAGAGNTIYGNNVGVYIVGTGGSSTGNQVLGNFIGLSANGASRPGNVLYGVILVNAPNNNVPQSGRSANKIVDSGIANFREYSGPIAPTTQSSSGSGSMAKKPATIPIISRIKPRGPRHFHAQIIVHGHTVPAGPPRKPGARVRH